MNDLESFQLMDQDDPLQHFRSHFHHNKNEIYFDGNSLGKMPKAVIDQLKETLEVQWGKQLIRSWNEKWLALPTRLSEKYAQFLNADPSEILFGESTSVRLYQVIYALLKSGKYPHHLITDNLNFPTDHYILQGFTKNYKDTTLTRLNYGQEIRAELDMLKDLIKEKPGIICLSLVTYKSAYLYPMQELNEWAEAQGALIIWDLSHAVGAVPIHLKDSGAKVAVGCTYKYMNGGPGAPAFLYINNTLGLELDNPIQGWFGHQNPFNFDEDYTPSRGLERFQNGTPSILSMQALEAGIDLSLAAGISAIRTKSITITTLIKKAVQKELEPFGFEFHSPHESLYRGSHIALLHPHAWPITQALIAGNKSVPKIIPDFRPPNLIRIGIAPLYTQYESVWWLISRLKELGSTHSNLNFSAPITKVP